MTFNECSPKSVTGDLLGASALKHGSDLSPDVVAQLDGAGLSAYAASYNKGIAESLNDQPLSLDNLASKEQQGFWNQFQGQLKGTYKGPDGGKYQQYSIASVLQDVASPESVLGADIVDEFDDMLQELAQAGIYSGNSYEKEINSFFDSVDTSNFTDGQRIHWEKYKNSYSKSSLPSKAQGSLLGKVEAIRKGVVIGSPTVIGGNFVEPFVKGIPLYKGNFFKGLTRLVNEHGAAGLFQELPDLKRQGLYGLDIGDRAPNGILERFISPLDRPSKNLMYYVGLEDGGTEAAGRKAIENVLFIPRMANQPLVYREPTGRVMTGLLSYSIGTMQLFTNVTRAAIQNPTPENLSTFAGLAGSFALIAGVPYFYEEQVEAIPVIGPLWKAASGVSSINVPNRIGITFDIFNRSIAKPISKVVAKTFMGEYEDITPQDLWAGTAAMAYMAGAPGSEMEAFASNGLVRRSVQNTLDVWTGEKEAGEAFTNVFMPWERD